MMKKTNLIIVFLLTFNFLQSQNSTANYENWYYNTRYGLVFETPRKMEQNKKFTKIPKGVEDYINNAEAYTYQEDDLVLIYLIWETNFTEYNTERGLKGAITNHIIGLNGTEISLNLFDVYPTYNDAECFGSFKYKDDDMSVCGYCLFNQKSSRVFTLIGYSSINNDKLKYIFNSIKIIK